MEKEGIKGLGRLGCWSEFIMHALHTHFLALSPEQAQRTLPTKPL